MIEYKIDDTIFLETVICSDTLEDETIPVVCIIFENIHHEFLPGSSRNKVNLIKLQCFDVPHSLHLICLLNDLLSKHLEMT